MAELTITCPSSTASNGAAATGIDIRKQVLVRTGGHFEQNTVLDITGPGAGWASFGEAVTFSGADEFTELTQVYLNGIQQLTAASASDNNDVYFVSASGNIAFEMHLQQSDILQFWKFNPTTSG
jgi:hypothetical protein